MLVEISIRDFAIIDRLTLALEPGLNVLTGETGAGKSIIIDAVDLVLGGRASTDMVRSGAEKAYIEAVFDITGLAALGESLNDGGFASAADEPLLVISREIARNGRSLTRINGRTATATALRDISQHLLDLHGQHEHQSLLRTERHLPLLDAFGGTEVAVAGDEVGRLHAEIAERRRALNRLSGDARDRARRLDLLRYQLQEIDAAAPASGEEEALRDERRVLANAAKLLALASAAYAGLYEGGGPRPALIDALADVAAELGQAGEMDKSLTPLREALDAARFQLEDAARELRRYRDRVQADPERLAEVDGRLEILTQLKRKYGDSVEEILRFRAEAAAELATIQGSEEAAARLETELDERRDRYARAASRLSRLRHETAGRLEQQVAAELGDLGMPRTVFQVSLETRPDDAGIEVEDRKVAFGSDGVDQVEFLLSPNPGEPPRPLARIASGGELARIMLALKTILAEVDQVPTLIFDEVDAGIGGRSAVAVARRLARLAAKRQVICVTHLAQIACLANAHYSISKFADDRHTTTQVSRLDPEQRVEEIVRMLGGAADNEVSRQHARVMLAEAQEFQSKAGSAT